MWKKSLNKFLNNKKAFMWTDLSIMILFIPLNTLVSIWKSNPWHHWISVGIWLPYMIWHLLKRDFIQNPEKYKLEDTENKSNDSTD